MSTNASKEPTHFSACANAMLALLSILLALAWTTAMVYSINPALPYNPMHLPSAGRAEWVVLAPQGWSFFTRDPRKEQLLVYGRGPDGWHLRLLGPHARLQNKLGLRRKSRAQGVELAQLMEKGQSAWEPCGAEVSECFARVTRRVQVRNPGPNPTICGTVAVVAREPVPWAWLRESEAVQMPSRILALEVLC